MFIHTFVRVFSCRSRPHDDINYLRVYIGDQTLSYGREGRDKSKTIRRIIKVSAVQFGSINTLKIKTFASVYSKYKETKNETVSNFFLQK